MSAPQNVEYKEVVTVNEITPECAVCTTSYGLTVRVEWKYGVPENAPSVGDTWLVVGGQNRTWAFERKYTSGEYNIMRYAITLDARDCVGRERSVADDIAAIGVDEVYLTVAAGGIAMWDSEVAANAGMVVYGDHITQLVRRLEDYSIAVTFVVRGDCFGSDSTLNQVDCYGSVKPRLSVATARSTCADIAHELYSMYKQLGVRGIVFSDFGLYDYRCDFSETALNDFLKSNGTVPDSTYVDFSDWGRHTDWIAFLRDEYASFFSTVYDGIEDWCVGAAVDDDLLDYVDSASMVGEFGTGLPDDFAYCGEMSVCVPLKYTECSDEPTALRSLEYTIAYAKRFCKGASPVYEVGIDDPIATDAMLSMLAKYDASTVLFDGYTDFCSMSDSEVIALKAAMSKYRITPKSTLQDVGLLVSTNSRDRLAFEDESHFSTNKAWTKCMENVAAEVLDRLPHRLAVLFDGDDFTLCSALIAPNVAYPVDGDKDALAEAIDGTATHVVVCGDGADYYFDRFGQVAGSETEYSGGAFLRAGEMDAVEDNYYLGAVSAQRAAVNEDNPFCKDGNGSTMPILISGRNSAVGVPMYDNSVAIKLIGNLAQYAIGRD